MVKSSKVIEKEQVVVRFSGDSGDGMQLTGMLFSHTSALYGNDISTFPDFPSEIRAPQGTIAGVSGYQVHFGSNEIFTPGDHADVLVAMNPAALKANAKFVNPGGVIIVDICTFDERNLQKAGYKTLDPFSEDKLGDYNIVRAQITTMTKESLSQSGLDNKSILRSKNMFALGIVYWLFDRPLIHTQEYINKKFKKSKVIADANLKVLEDGYNYGGIIQLGTPSYQVRPSHEMQKGFYRNINGNTATAWGFIAASQKSGLELFLGSYPITPATDILHELALRKDMGVKVFQAEDEIAGICTAIGASFAGDLAITTTSGPGLALKGEAIGLAVMSELPIVIVNVQRGGPSTGLPTKTEQSDLFQALYGRNGDSPCVVMAASTPTNCFDYAFYSAKIALEHMTPVILLTDGFLANGTQPWLLPNLEDFPEIKPPFAKTNDGDWKSYKRDDEKLARTWAIPGTANLQHRIGGLEKDVTGSVSHDPLNHQKMCELREAKVQRVANFIPELEVLGDKDADTLIVGWGGTFGHLYSTLDELRSEGKKVALAHFNYIKPLPKNSKEVLSKYKNIVVCELNMGQFANYLRMNFPEIPFLQYNKIQGAPFTVVELKNHLLKFLEA